MSPAPKEIIKVEVCHGVRQNFFDVVITNRLRQTIRPVTGMPLSDALTEANDWADFFGVTLAPFFVKGVQVHPVSRHTYDGVIHKSIEQLREEYRGKTGELNWNKLMYHEWKQLSGVHKNRDGLLKALLPLMIEGPSAPEWLAENAKGVWMTVKGGYRFDAERDMTLYKVFHIGG